MPEYAVVGNPVQHSKSPRIHHLFAEQTAIELSYVATEVEIDNFEGFVREFFAKGGSGLNITVPFKEKAFAMADSLSDRASLAKAVNTLFLDREGKLCGENTDGIGIVRDISINNNFVIRDKNVLLLGAGGAVRGALAALVYEQPAKIIVANRTLEKAQQLREEFQSLANISACSYDELPQEKFDLIINGTSLSLAGELPPISESLIAEQCCCYDMMYSSEDTAYVNWARSNGAALAVDGLGMLVEQAAEAFAIWHGVRPETASVIKALSASNP